MSVLELILPTPEDTDAVGAALAQSLPATSQGLLIELHGDLGMGKTALTRALLRALGVTGSVRSPTYTLCEPYEAGGWQVMHMDLYRLGDPEELDYLGVRELDSPGTLAIVEWPDNGAGWLPKPVLQLVFSDRVGEPGRVLRIHATSGVGREWLQNIVISSALKDYM